MFTRDKRPSAPRSSVATVVVLSHLQALACLALLIFGGGVIAWFAMRIAAAKRTAAALAASSIQLQQGLSALQTVDSASVLDAADTCAQQASDALAGVHTDRALLSSDGSCVQVAADGSALYVKDGNDTTLAVLQSGGSVSVNAPTTAYLCYTAPAAGGQPALQLGPSCTIVPAGAVASIQSDPPQCVWPAGFVPAAGSVTYRGTNYTNVAFNTAAWTAMFSNGTAASTTVPVNLNDPYVVQALGAAPTLVAAQGWKLVATKMPKPNLVYGSFVYQGVTYKFAEIYGWYVTHNFDTIVLMGGPNDATAKLSVSDPASAATLTASINACEQFGFQFSG